MISMRAHLSRCEATTRRAYLPHVIASGPNLLRHFSFSLGESFVMGSRLIIISFARTAIEKARRAISDLRAAIER